MKGRLTVRQVIKQIGRYEYYRARKDKRIAIYEPVFGHPYHDQQQVDEYIARANAEALRPAIPTNIDYRQPKRRVTSGKILNSPYL